VLDTIEKDGLLDRAAQAGERLQRGLADPRVVEIRGSGLLIGLTLTAPRTAEVAAAAMDAGFILNNATPERVRLAPPLIVTDADIDALVAAWPGILDVAYGGPR
jgi:acetylornithine aminotransferase